MKKVECVIKKHNVEKLFNALLNFDVWGVTEIPVKGCGRQKGYADERYYMDKTARVLRLPQVKLEFVVKDEVVEPLIELILRTIGRGEIGNGKIFVYPCDTAIRISTNERGLEAISP